VLHHTVGVTLPLRTPLVAALAASALVFAACGGDSGSSSSSSTSDGGATAARPAGTVGMKNIKFVPDKITVKVGEKVTWRNEESIPHDVVADSGADFKSEVFGKDGTFAYTPTKAGTIKYECTLHPGMVGEVVVQG
jgi:plastocyanin